MCQAKNEGGKRCLTHSAATKFLRKNIHLTTGADHATIDEAYKELSKEGRTAQHTPTSKEFNSFIGTEQFDLAVSNIDGHDKKILNNQLEKATQEAKKQGVTARAWYVWTNMKTRVVTKLKAAGQWVKTKGAKLVLATGIVGTMAFGVAGCAQNDPTPPAPTQTQSQTAEPDDGKTQKETIEVGDAIVKTDKNGNPIIITNEHGEYKQLTINPEDDAYSDYSKINKQSLKDNGVTMEQAKNAQHIVATHMVENVIDGPGINSDKGYQEWLNNNLTKCVVPDQVEAFRNFTPKNGSSDKSLFIGNSDMFGGPFITDGTVREKDAKVAISDVSGYTENGKSYVKVQGTASVSHRMSDEALLSTTMKKNPDLTKEQILGQYPKMDNGKENYVNKNIDYTFYLTTDGKFAGISMNYAESDIDVR